MKNLLGKIIGLLLVYFLNVFSIMAQDTVVPIENSFKNFQSINAPLERFQLFFETPNRYTQNSAYDWLDTVNIYLNTVEKTHDSLAITQYKLIQAQIYYDLGNYDRSLAIAKEIKNQVEELDLDTKEILFDLMDRDYAQLGLYTEQIEIRKEKKALGLTDNVAFYDIYSNLGLHRKAMIDYIESVQKTIDEKDYFAQAEFYNNVGTYLRLDKSIPTALTNYKKAKGFIDVYLSDVTKVKSESDLHEAHFLNSSIEGNIGKCHVQLELYKEAIPFLEESVKGMAQSKKGAFSSEIIENRLALAECFLQLGDLKEATDYLSDNIQPKMTANLIKKNRLLSIYYDLLGDYKNSSLYLKKNIRINDSLSINESELRKQQLVTVMAEEKANTRLIMDAQKLALEQQRNEMIAKDEKISLVFISLIFTLLGFAGLVYAYLKSIKNQRLIAEQKHI
ncbi:MAG: tetratricopeptide repeat protein, partial [Maribacter sp.]|nr:tetratricopeptide repeat protein [Maribacter sp.]